MINRRKVFGLVGGLLTLVGLKTQAIANVPVKLPEWTPVTWLGHFDSFPELEVALNALPNQCIGRQTAYCETGGEYEEVYASAICRPDDTRIMESLVATEMGGRLSWALSRKTGKIYWRKKLEWEFTPTETVIVWDKNGPDYSLVLDKRGYFDKNWVRVHSYARLYRAAV